MMDRAYLFDEQRWRPVLDADYLIDDGPAQVWEYDDALVLPTRLVPGTAELYGDGLLEGGVCDRDGCFVAGQFRRDDRPESNRSCIRAYAVDEADVCYRDETVVFGGILVSHWGHMLVDATSRLWYPATAADPKLKIVFLRFQKQDFPYGDLLALAGIAQERYEIVDAPTRFAKVIVPQETSHSITGRFRKEWISFFNKVRDGVDPSPYQKVYLTRTAFRIDNVVGEDYFEDYYRKRGYEVFSPEKLSIAEQVELMAGARDIATTMGTISHLVLFAHEGVNIDVLNRSKEPVAAQVSIDRARQSNAVYIDAYRNFLPETQGGNCVFLLAPNKQWNAYIRDRFGDDPDAGFEGERFPALALSYMRKWGDVFSTKSKFRWIRNFTLEDVVRDVNFMLNDKVVDTSGYYEPTYVEALRERVFQETCSPQKAAALTSISMGKDTVFLGGGASLPFCDWVDKDVRVCLCPAGGQRCRADFAVAKTLVDGQLSWMAAIPSESIRAFVEAEQAAGDLFFALAMRGEDGQELVLPLLAPKASRGVGGGVPFARLVFADSFLSLAYCFDRRPCLRFFEKGPVLAKATRRVESLEWDENGLTLAGTLETPASAFEDLSLALALVGFGEKSDWEFRTPCALLPATEPGASLRWRAEIALGELERFAVDAACDIRLDLNLCLRSGGHEHLHRIGAGSDSAQIETYVNGAVRKVGERFLVPYYTAPRNLSFEVVSESRLVKSFYFEHLSWSASALRCSGWMHSLLTLRDDMSVSLYLKAPNARLLPIELSGLECAEEHSRLVWSFALAQADIVAFVGENGVGVYTFEIAVRFGGFEMAAQTGYQRKKGTLALFEALPEPLSASGIEATIENRCLAFRTGTASCSGTPAQTEGGES